MCAYQLWHIHHLPGLQTHRVGAQVLCSIDGSHIPIIKLPDSGDDYINRKGFHAMLLQVPAGGAWCRLAACSGAASWCKFGS
jgi:hypothetical protein